MYVCCMYDRWLLSISVVNINLEKDMSIDLVFQLQTKKSDAE
jgi:hypothetical protein